jgi:type IV pilus assembly protein PilB
VNDILNDMLERDKHIPTDVTLYKAVGCEKCNNTGYKGRVGIFELILMDEELEVLLRTTTAEHEIERFLHEKGRLSLKEDGMIKIFNGRTTLDEMHRVIDLED